MFEQVYSNPDIFKIYVPLPDNPLKNLNCYVLKAENEELVEQFLREREDYALEAFRLGDKFIDNGMHCFWPNIDGTDGFFAAKLKRIK